MKPFFASKATHARRAKRRTHTRTGSRAPLALLYVGILAFFGIFFVLPILTALRGAFLDQTGAFTLDYLIEVFRNPVYLEGFAKCWVCRGRASAGPSECQPGELFGVGGWITRTGVGLRPEFSWQLRTIRLKM